MVWTIRDCDHLQLNNSILVGIFYLTLHLGVYLGGRNRKVSEAFVTSGKTIEQLETEMLNGQKLQGPITAKEVNYMLANKKMEEK